MPPDRPTHLLTGQAAKILHVSPKTLSRWAQEGRVSFTRTLGGHRRYNEQEMRELAKTLVVEVKA